MYHTLSYYLRQLFDFLTDPLWIEYPPGEKRKAKLTAVFLLILTLTVSWIGLTSGDIPLFTILILGAAYILSRRNHYIYAAVVLIVILCVSIYYFILNNDPNLMDAHPLQWLLLPIILAVFLLPLRGLIVVILAVLFSVGIISLLYPTSFLLESFVFLLVSSLLIVLVAYQRIQSEAERETELKRHIKRIQREVQERKQFEGLLQKNMTQLDELRRLTLTMTAELDVQKLLELIVNNGLQLLGGDQGAVFLYDDEAEVFTLGVNDEDEAVPKDRVVPRNHGIIGQAWESGETVVVGNYHTWDGRIQEIAETIEQKSFIATPLKWRDETPGVLILSSSRRNYFTDDHTSIIEFLATQATIALQNAQLNAEIQKNTKRLQTEIKERSRAEAALRDSQKMLRIILDSLPIRVFWKDLDLNYLGCNLSFAADVGLSVDEVIGKTVHDLAQYQPQDAEQYHAQDKLVIQTNEPQFNMIRSHPQENGQTIWRRVNKLPLLNHDGELIGMVGTYEDITEQIRAQEQLEQYTKELEFTNRELQKFAYVASHDLQEPLRKIQTFGKRLVERHSDRLDERGLDYLNRMHSSANRMQILLQDLLAYSRVTMGSLEFEPVDLVVIVREVQEDLELKIEEENAQIIVQTLPVLEADPVQMKQLFYNLISNALKFSHKDIAPVVHIEANENRQGFWQVSIIDNGIGFDAKYEERVFGVFQRLHTRQEYEGTGVGLALCKQVVERHRGEISARSRPGEGATFIVTLPEKQT